MVLVLPQFQMKTADVIYPAVNNPNESWQLFQGCWHSFRKTCLNSTSSCPLCEELLTHKVQELGLVPKEAILYPHNDEETSINECTYADAEDTNTMTAPEIPECVNLQEINETVNDLNSTISSLRICTAAFLREYMFPC